MSDNSLNLLFEVNKGIIADLQKIILGFRGQDYDFTLRKASGMFKQLSEFLRLFDSCMDALRELGISISTEYFAETLNSLIDAQESRDYVFLSDLYEAQLLPMLTHTQEVILQRKEVYFDKGRYIKSIEIIRNSDSVLYEKLSSMPEAKEPDFPGYSLEYTSGGDMTAAVSRGSSKLYLHSNINVWKEACLLARSWYLPDINTYIIYGLGLGYHISELLQLNSFLNIEVYESNFSIIQLACAYTDNIKLFSNPRVKLVYDPDFTRLSGRIENMDEGAEFVIHYPSLQALQDGPVKQRLENYFIRYSSVKSQLPLLNGNFTRNIKNCDGYIDELREAFKGRDLYIIAAGPSLDKNYLQLKNINGKGIILATGTVFKKLLNAGITPDYVLVTDPNARVYKQIAGAENSEVPMLLLSTAYFGFASKYKGKKYLICQRDYQRSEDYAGEKGWQLFNTGGSVSTTALDIGIAFGCRRIIFAGLDLAYTDRYAHASSTSRRNAADFDNQLQVTDIYGKMVYTSRSLNMFRIWIENRISNEKGIEFIDATEGGARIKGMRIARLADVIN